ncbi:MAG: hypothetical protein E7447_02015 [Ruminococcaceae bacterium]|nr:hypothetical protein [Oscillospiraceae bacterium]
MGDCKGGCGGCCGNCGGCGSTLVLNAEEIAMLRLLGQIPFLPVARSASSMDPVYLEEGELSPEKSSLALRCLEKRGLISIDFDQPLKGGYSKAYDAYPIKGSVALTILGQQAVDLLEIQGVE